ncbi:hypothetical protein [Clostridium sp. C8-1-8]|uniref:hypothetical protein n=1 Tax=Clostridium sp. C8-1-8 TaxID=2698831 RepID=UPI00136B40C5|nr:hypothetical protein [Clostridium sp. C8-1-8]
MDVHKQKKFHTDEQIARLQHQVKYLKQENEFKKNKFYKPTGAMEEQAKPEEKFKIIQKMIRRDNNLLNISWLCECAESVPFNYLGCLNKTDFNICLKRLSRS